MNFNPNDPKWTAYVLNELSDRERAEVEQEMSQNPEAKKLVEEIRMVTGELTNMFAGESVIELDQAQRRSVMQQAKKTSGSMIRFPSWRFATIGVAVAAMLIAFFGMPLYQKELLKTEQEITPADKKVTGSPAELPANKVEAQPRKALSDVDAGKKTKGAKEELRIQVGIVSEELESGSVAAPPASAPAMDQSMVRHALGFANVSKSMVSRSRMAMPNAEQYVASPYGPSLDDFDEIRDNVFQRVADHPLSTFSIDVDTASYSVVRKMLTEGRLPPKDAVRIEELINYFLYEYQPPVDGKPFSSNMEIAPCPWKPEHYLVRVALKGRVIEKKDRPACNLVYLLDVSGSMYDDNKLPLVKRALQALIKQLDERDRVAIVVYAGAAGLVLPSTRGDHAQSILDAIEKLQAGGSTAGGEGIKLAYQTAREHFNSNAVNRVILCTDGDFNVGMTQRGDLERMIEQEAKSGVFLTVLGFGMGNYKDSTLELLSNKGNGNYAYIDDFSEARKVLVDEFLGTLVTIAKDVKIQVEFNPAHVAGYRLIGYENRMLKKEDFNNDKVDAGEIGAGHTVTAFYEIIPVGQPFPDVPVVDELKYQAKPMEATESKSGEILTLKLRYKEPDGDVSSKLEFPLGSEILAAMDPSQDFRFASAVAGFGMLLRESEHRGNITYEKVLNLAEQSIGEDKLGYRAEFIKLVRNAQAIAGK